MSAACNVSLGGMIARLEEAAPLAGETMGVAVGEVLLSVQGGPPGLW